MFRLRSAFSIIIIPAHAMLANEALPHRQAQCARGLCADHAVSLRCKNAPGGHFCIIERKVTRFGPDDAIAPEGIAQRQRHHLRHTGIAAQALQAGKRMFPVGRSI